MTTRFGSYRRFLLIGLVGLSLLPAEVGAQTAAPHTGRPDRFWLSAGLGVGSARQASVPDLGLAATATASYQHGVPVVVLRTAADWGIIHGDLLADVALLGGVGTRVAGSHASIAIGPALTGSTVGSFGRHRVDYPTTLGAAVQVQLFGIAFHSLGFGLSGFGNLNRYQSFGGLTLALSVGAMPP
jgi:hypothetical protein